MVKVKLDSIKMSNIYPGIDFSEYIEGIESSYTERSWIFKCIDEWLRDLDAPRFFLISGEPGSGKTALASRLYQISMNKSTLNTSISNDFDSFFLSAVYFCSANNGMSYDPKIFTESLAAQLATNHPTYKEAMEKKIKDDHQIHLNVHLENIMAVNATGVIVKIDGEFTETAFNTLIWNPLETICQTEPAEKIIILIDGLDEALTYNKRLNIVTILARLNKLPKSVRFIVTSRPDATVQNELLRFSRLLYISDPVFNAKNDQDIANYVSNRFTHESNLKELIESLHQDDTKS